MRGRLCIYGIIALLAKLGLIPIVMISGKKQTVVCTVEDPDPVGAIRWRIGDRLALDQHLNLVHFEKTYFINGYVYLISRYQNMLQCPFSQLFNPNLACSRQQP